MSAGYKRICTVLIILGLLSQNAILAAEKQQEKKLNFDMKEYSVSFEKGLLTVSRDENEVITLGNFELRTMEYDNKWKQSNVLWVGKRDVDFTVEEEGDKKEVYWEGKNDEFGLYYKFHVSVCPEKLIYTFGYKFNKPFKGFVKFSPCLFPGNTEIILNQPYQGLDRKGNAFEGTFPATTELSWKERLINKPLGEITIHSGTGKIKFSIEVEDYPYWPVRIAFPLIVFDLIRKDYGKLIEEKGYIYPSDYMNFVELAISFNGK
jgi:hypothetical protein